MSDIEKKLDALIDALGFDVEEVIKNFEVADKSRPEAGATFMLKQVVDYKLTKRKVKKTNKSAEERLSEATARMGQQ
tara:strand:+ start:1273 stop:1503 length:231 start_codon:yes stop_codon:yes gene_type:complete